MTKKIPEPSATALMAESMVGCKWSLHVLGEIRRGVRRPGALERSAAGLTRKVLTERLRKMERFGIIERRSFPVIPPHVEYHLTTFGRKFSKVLDAIHRLDGAKPKRG